MPTRIDWCDETINPLGFWCFGPGGTRDNPQTCPFCYAKRIATRKMAKCELCHDFKTPHTHFEQLEKLAKWKKPRTVFVQSMGDLFHGEVPDRWIKDVFEVCAKAPQHRYLFLTKNPYRYTVLRAKRELPKAGNMWYGVTPTADNGMFYASTHNIFISAEPLLEGVPLPTLTDWMIVGSETGNRIGKTMPCPEHVKYIVDIYTKQGVPVFLKNNLAPIVGEEYVKAHQKLPWAAK